MLDHDSSSYAVDALDPITAEAVSEVAKHSGAPLAAIATAAQLAQAIVCQALVAYRNPSTGLLCPISQNFLLVLENSERRSTVTKYFMQDIQAHDHRSAAAYGLAMADYQAKHSVWRAMSTGLRDRLRAAKRRGDGIAEAMQELEDHVRFEPSPPRLRQYLLEEATKASIYEALEGDGESIAFFTDEAETLYESGLLRGEALGNKLFDGDRPLTLRSKGRVLYCANPKATVCVMAHPVSFHNRQKKRGPESRGTGHDARYLVAAPPSTKGNRPVHEMPPDFPALEPYRRRLNELMELRNARIASGTSQVEELEFGDDAKARWFGMAQWIESELAPGKFFADTADFGAKFMDHVGRTAARLHYFQGLSGKISDRTLERAIRIVWFHANEFRRFYSEQLKAQALLEKAMSLMDYLRRHHWQGPHIPNQVAKNRILQGFHPKDVAELNQLLAILEEEGVIFVSKGKPAMVTLLSDAFMPGVPATSGIFYGPPLF